MKSKLEVRTHQEIFIQDMFRELAIKAMHKYTEAELCEKFGVYPVAIRWMLSEPVWPFEQSIRVLDALDLRVDKCVSQTLLSMSITQD